MQGRLADGTQLEGIPVFAEAYKRANLPTLGLAIYQAVASTLVKRQLLRFRQIQAQHFKNYRAADAAFV